MPVTITAAVTPLGNKIVRTQNTGLIDLAESEHFLQQVRPGGQYHGLPLLAVLEKDAYFSVESRRAFVAAGGVIAVVAMVVTNAPLRVMLTFVDKAARAVASKPSNVRFFSTEAEALAWLDEAVAAPAALAS